MADEKKLSPRELAAQTCRDMADRIDRQQDTDFSGALLVIGPDQRKIEMVMVDPSLDKAAFWAIAKSKIEIAASEAMADEEQRRQGGWR